MAMTAMMMMMVMVAINYGAEGDYGDDGDDVNNGIHGDDGIHDDDGNDSNDDDDGNDRNDCNDGINGDVAIVIDCDDKGLKLPKYFLDTSKQSLTQSESAPVTPCGRQSVTLGCNPFKYKSSFTVLKRLLTTIYNCLM